MRPLILLIFFLMQTQILSWAQAPAGLLPEFFPADKVAQAGIREVHIYQPETKDSLGTGKRRFLLNKNLIEHLNFDERGNKTQHEYLQEVTEILEHKNSYTFDGQGRNTGIHYQRFGAGGPLFERMTLFNYDQQGNKTNQKIFFVSDSGRVADSETFFSYDDSGKITEEKTLFLAAGMEGRSRLIRYQWTGDIQVDKEYWIEGEKESTERFKIEKGRLVFFTVPGSAATNYAYFYNTQGQLIREEWVPFENASSIPAVIAIVYAYNSKGFLQRVSRKYMDQSWSHKIFSYRYE